MRNLENMYYIVLGTIYMTRNNMFEMLYNMTRNYNLTKLYVYLKDAYHLVKSH